MDLAADEGMESADPDLVLGLVVGLASVVVAMPTIYFQNYPYHFTSLMLQRGRRNLFIAGPPAELALAF